MVIPLGLMVPDSGVEARGGQDVPGVAAGGGARVHLVDSVRVPARTAVIVKGKIEAGGCVGMPLMFNPDDRWMAGEGLQLETSLLEADSDGLVDLVVCNPEGMTKMVRDAGSVGMVEIVDEEEEEWVEDQPVVHVSFVRSEVPEKADRRVRLVQAVDICKLGGTVDGAAKLQQCVVQAADVFALDKGELGQVVDLCHTIETGDSAPVRLQPRRVPFALRPELTKMINDMLGAKVIQESSSPWASPIVLVRKKDGSLRFCADYRRLNAVTRKDVYPLPCIDDLLDQLGGKKVFSTLDARTGYWQIRMEESAREKTAFVTMEGLYEFCVMPFGLCNAPATFQRLMQKALSGLGGEEPFCSVYIDDVIVYSDSVESHIQHLQQVFERLRRIGLRLHPQKCRFAYPEVAFLGHVISAVGIAPNPDKVRAVREFKVPTNVRMVREFLGLAGYYRRFVPNFSKVAGPLHNLTRQDVPFVWTQRCQGAFDSLKDRLTTPPVLAYPCFTKPFVLHTDASGLGLGAVLEQEQEDGRLHPVSYASRTLSKHESRYGITDLEGVVWACKHFRAYLLGHRTVVYTDHAPLKAMLKAKHPSGKLARWAGIISELDLDIQYRPGRKNANADALSRCPLERVEDSQIVGVVAQVSEVDCESLGVGAEELVKLQVEDNQLSQLRQYLQDGELPEDGKQAKRLVLEKERFVILDGVLYYVDPGGQHRLRIAVPKKLRETLIKETHAGPFGGHFAGRGLYKALAQHYWWDGMFGDVVRWCRSCLTCAAYQGCGRRAKPPLQPIAVGAPFERVGVDILEMPRTLRGHRYVVVFVEYLTKWVEAYAVEDQTSETLARLLVDRVVCRHGVPAELLSDRGSNLLSNLILEVCELLGMKKVNTTSYHPQTDGLVERMNKTLRSMLAKHAHKFGPDWDLHLQQLLFAYRVKPQDSTGESPFYLLYGRDARLPTGTAVSRPLTPYQENLDDYRSSLVAGLSEAWAAAKQSIGSMTSGPSQRSTRLETVSWCSCRMRHKGRTESWLYLTMDHIE